MIMEIVTEIGEIIKCVRITFKSGYAEAWDKNGECIWCEKTRDIFLVRESGASKDNWKHGA